MIRSHTLQHCDIECHNVITLCHYIFLWKCTVHIQSIDHRIYQKAVLAQDSYRDHETPHIVYNQQFDALFTIRGNLNTHAPKLVLICAFLRPIIIVLYYIDISVSPMSLFIPIVLVTFVSRYTFCRASKDQSETGFLLFHVSHIYNNSRSYRNYTSDIRTPMSLFCGLPRTYSTSSTLQSFHSIFYVSLTIYFFFNMYRMGTCCTEI